MSAPMKSPSRSGVAVIGIGCRFPGGIAGPQDFWRVLVEGRDTIGPIPAGRFDLARVDPAVAALVPPFGGYLDGIDQLDTAFFGMSPREAERLDPQQRLLLETAWEALEDAGQDIVGSAGGRGGVFIGQWISDFEGRLLADAEQFDFFMTTGSGRYAASGRLSALLGWCGPSITVDTACSSSLVAVHLAVRCIQAGDSEIALVGAANVILEPHISIGYARSGMLAADGRCKFGDASADGYGRSEGAAVLVLKQLEKAVQEDDRIYAVILGSAVNNDGGSSGSMGTPSQTGQEALLRIALADAGLQPIDVGYVEAHGTGTKAGDPVEIGAIGAVLGRCRAKDEPLLIGSVKTNIGHTESTAGLAGLIKAVMAVKDGLIPASLNNKVPNPSIPWADLRCRVGTKTMPWTWGMRRIASVNSLGIAGTNAHVLVGEPPSPRVVPSAAPAIDRCCILPLSARSPDALRALARRYAKFLSQSNAPSLLDVCRNAAIRRSQLHYRAAFVADNIDDMAKALARYAEGEPADAEGEAGDQRSAVAFVAPGQGGQWAGMAQALLAGEPVFREALVRCDAAASEFLNCSIVDLIANGDRPDVARQLERIEVIQPTLVALSIAYAKLLATFGVRPDAIVGHSMGEIAAAHIAGIIDVDTAMRLICRRSSLMSAASGKGGMALVEMSLPEARLRIAVHQGHLAVAAHNGPRSCVLSGDLDALTTVLRDLEAEGVFCRAIKVDVASHSPQMETAAVKLVAEFGGLQPSRAGIPIYSTVRGRRVTGEEFVPAYWGDNLTQPVLFADAIQAIDEGGISTFVELGPHPVLLPSIQQTVHDSVVGVCGRHDEPDSFAIVGLLAALWVKGVELDWAVVLPGPDRFVRLPTYPWQRERHWHAGADIPPMSVSTAHRLKAMDDEQRSWLHRLVWRPLNISSVDPALSVGPWLVVGEGSTADTVAAVIEKGGGSVRRVALDGLRAALGGEAGSVRIVVAPGPAPDPFLPVCLVQALAEAVGPLHVWIVSDGAQSVSGEPADVAGAALWGAARVVREEWPELNLVMVDMPIDAAATADLELGHVLHQRHEDQIAIRNGQCLGLRIVPTDPPAPVRAAWRPDAAYLITGGLGDIGLLIAAAMVDQGARRIILMGRSPLPERSSWLSREHPDRVLRRIDAVRRLEAKGASIHLACVDVANEAALAGFLDRYSAEGWPAIAGVVHAAGSFANRLSRDMTADEFRAVLDSKLGGATLLDRLLPELDFFVLFSSSGGYLPQSGQSNYAAANAGLEAIALQRQLRGQHAACLAWGPWAGVGLVSDVNGQANVAEMERQGYHAIPPHRATELFAHLCAVNSGALIICQMDWDTYLRECSSARKAAIFDDLRQGRRVDGVLTNGDIENLDSKSLRTRIETIVREAVGHVLKMSPGKLAVNQTLGSMGMTSLIAMELRNRLERALNRPLAATIVWNRPTIGALVDYLCGSDQDVSAPDAAQKPDQSAVTSLASSVVDAMSEDEVLRQLTVGRSRGGRR